MSFDQRRKKQSGVAGDSNAKKILARTLYNEFSKNQWTRGEILEYVNIFLDLVIANSGGTSAPTSSIDTETGFVTRQGFQDLLRHELDPAVERQFASSLLVFKIPSANDVVIAAKILENELRVHDVISPQKNQILAVILQAPTDTVENIFLRLNTKLERRMSTQSHSTRRCLKPPAKIRPLWMSVLRELNAMAKK
jgi:hypothetical protein